MTSTMTFLSFLLGCILLQGIGVTAARYRIPESDNKLTTPPILPTGSQKQLTDHNMTEERIAITCSCDNPCHDGSSCYTAHTDGILVAAVCIQDGQSSFSVLNTIPFVEIEPLKCSGICIAADMLNDFESHQLIFENHVLAQVLCDSSGSCATKGHIVNYKGTGMMMKTYCDIVGCQNKVMQVNSPKYSRALKVKSNSPDMHFTAFAARFETRGEEAVLSTAIRVGF